MRYSLEEQAQVDGGYKIIVTWFKDDKQMNLAGLNGKCRLLDAGTLEVKSTDSSDKCVVSNAYGAISSLPAQVHVEHSNNLFVAFQSNLDPTVLPSAPTQPVAVQSSAQSLTLTWQPSTHSGHSLARVHALEYFAYAISRSRDNRVRRGGLISITEQNLNDASIISPDSETSLTDRGIRGERVN